MAASFTRHVQFVGSEINGGMGNHSVYKKSDHQSRQKMQNADMGGGMEELSCLNPRDNCDSLPNSCSCS